MNIEKFIIELGFVDKEAVKGIKDFLGKVDQAARKSNNKLKGENSLLSTKNSLMRKIIEAEKLGMDTQHYRKSHAAIQKIDTARRKTLELEKEILKVKDAQVKKAEPLRVDLPPKVKEPPQDAHVKARVDALKRTAKLEDELREATNKEILRDTKVRVDAENKIKAKSLKVETTSKFNKTKEPPQDAHIKARAEALKRTAKLEADLAEATNKEILRDTKARVAVENKIKAKPTQVKEPPQDAHVRARQDALKQQAKLEADLKKASAQEALRQAKAKQDSIKRTAKLEAALADAVHQERLRDIKQEEAARIVAAKKAQAADVAAYKFSLSKNARYMQSQGKDIGDQVDQYRRAHIAGDVKEMHRLRAAIDATSLAMRRHTRTMVGMQTVQNGLRDSTRNLIRSFASLYAVGAGAAAINKTGQSFEALNSAMLAAMGSTESATAEIDFLDKMTSRLGMSLVDTADSYTKFIFASKGKLDTGQVRELFEGLSEMGTVLGISKDRMKLSMTAIQQINGLPI